VLVEDADKCLQRFPQQPVDRGRLLDAAGQRRAAHAIRLDMRGLGHPQHIADADLDRRPGQLEAPGAATARGDEPTAHQNGHDLRHIVFGNSVQPRDIGGPYKPVTGKRAVNQDPNCVTCLLGQAHRFSS